MKKALHDFNLQTGFIYVAKSTSLKDNLHKVGRTTGTKTVNERLKEEYEEMMEVIKDTLKPFYKYLSITDLL